MRSSYDESEAKRFVDRYRQSYGDDLALRVYTSRLLGSEPSLVLHGGGNTSVKSRAKSIAGEELDVIFVKGSGWDLASIEPAGFPACRLAALRRLCELPELSDEDMVKALRAEMLDPSSPTPSVEALLHAFLPAKVVDHTHADAVLAVVDQPNGVEHARRVWGDGLLLVPYVMPGFVLAKKIVELRAELERARVMVLDKHGIFTWGDTAKESYERMIEAVSAAERYIESRRAQVTVPKGLDEHDRRLAQRALSPILRGALGRAPSGQRFVIEWRDEREILSLLAREDAERVTAIGTITPDHVIRTKPTPMFLRDHARPGVEAAVAAYADGYEEYFERCSIERGRRLVRLDPLPRIVLVPELGAACLGATRKDARIAGDIYVHTAAVIQDALALGYYRPVSELDLFDVEYWSLEQAKLKVGKSAAGVLSRRIALVTGAAAGIGRATAERLLELGAHVMLTDRDNERLSVTRTELAQKYGLAVAMAPLDVTSDDQVRAAIDQTVDSFGGFDLLVSNAGTAPSGLLHTDEGDEAFAKSLEINLLGHQRVARHAVAVMIAQDLGGCLLFNASKSAFNQGPEFGPYAIPKAAVVALMKQYAVDLGARGIRANAVNADRIRTDLFGGGVLEARAKARGISPDAYFQQNLIGRETTARDVADAFAYLASAEATTGCIVTVDGGNAAAFPR